MSNTLFTADLHFNHKNIIKYCDRPFNNVDEMNEKIISGWNSQVDKEDRVIVIGDFAFAEPDYLKDLIFRLNGYIDLVPGNHDAPFFKMLKKYPELLDYVKVLPPIYEETFQVEDERIPFVFCHYAMRVWNKSHHGAIHLYGHSHGSLPDDPNALSMDVGIDTAWNKPSGYLYTLDEILEKMYKKKFKPVDHHDGKR